MPDSWATVSSHLYQGGLVFSTPDTLGAYVVAEPKAWMGAYHHRCDRPPLENVRRVQPNQRPQTILHQSTATASASLFAGSVEWDTHSPAWISRLLLQGSLVWQEAILAEESHINTIHVRNHRTRQCKNKTRRSKAPKSKAKQSKANASEDEDAHEEEEEEDNGEGDNNKGSNEEQEEMGMEQADAQQKENDIEEELERIMEQADAQQEETRQEEETQPEAGAQQEEDCQDGEAWGGQEEESLELTSEISGTYVSVHSMTSESSGTQHEESLELSSATNVSVHSMTSESSSSSSSDDIASEAQPRGRKRGQENAVQGPRAAPHDRYPRLVHNFEPPLTDGHGSPLFHGVRLVRNPTLRGGQTDSLTAFCGFRRQCKTSATLNGSLSKPAQGRPLGMLWSWLEHAHLFSSKEDHCRARLTLEDPLHSYEARLAARMDAYEKAVQQGPWDFEWGGPAAERPRWPCEGEEPEENP